MSTSFTGLEDTAQGLSAETIHRSFFPRKVIGKTLNGKPASCIEAYPRYARLNAEKIRPYSSEPLLQLFEDDPDFDASEYQPLIDVILLKFELANIPYMLRRELKLTNIPTILEHGIKLSNIPLIFKRGMEIIPFIISGISGNSKNKFWALQKHLLPPSPIQIGDRASVLDTYGQEFPLGPIPCIQVINKEAVRDVQLSLDSTAQLDVFHELFLFIPRILLESTRQFSLLDESLEYDEAFTKTEEMVMFEYMCHHDKNVDRWKSSISLSKELHRLLETLTEGRTIRREHGTLVIETKHGSIFLSDDFYVAHDSRAKLVLTMVPGSPAILLPTTGFSMRALTWKVLSYQLFLLARRICQFTNATWHFDCLADLEKKREGAKQLNVFDCECFKGVVIDLDPMRFSFLVGYKVGYVDVGDGDYFNVGIDMFGDIIVLRYDEDEDTDIAEPEVYKGEVKGLEPLRSFTDAFDIFIGGDHERSMIMNAEGQIEASPVSAMDVPLLPAPPITSVGVCIRDKRVPLKKCGETPVYNLGFVPQNKEFNYLWNIRYTRFDLPKKLENDLKNRLKYGEQLSYEISRLAPRLLRGPRTEITLGEAQNELFVRWRKPKFQNGKWFSLQKAKHHQGWYLMFVSGKLHAVKSVNAITTGVNGYVSGGIPGFTATGGASVSSTPHAFTQKFQVVNLLDAAVKVSGKNPGFNDNRSSKWYKPTKQGMEKILGGLAVVCTLLDGKVDARGMFYGAVTEKELDRETTKQQVDFNIPIPLGLAYSTLSRTTEPYAVSASTPGLIEKMVFDRANQHVFFVDGRNYNCPLILGGKDRDEELIKALRNSVGYDGVPDQEDVSEHEGDPDHNNGPSAGSGFFRSFVRPRGRRRMREVMVNSDNLRAP